MNEKKIELKDQIKGAIAMPSKDLVELIKKKTMRCMIEQAVQT